MAEISWIKIRTDMFDDNKIKIIQSMPDGDSLLVIWIRLITLSGTTNAGGYVYLNENIPFTEDMMSVICAKPPQIIKFALSTFQQMGMIEVDDKGIYLVNFSKHQNADKLLEIREYNRLKQQESREKRNKLLDNSVNDMSMTCTLTKVGHVNLDKEEDKEEDKEKELNNNEQMVAHVWSRYPVKKGRSTAYKKLPKLIEKYGMEQLIRCIQRYEQTDSFKKGFKKQGDTFFNGAYVDYLDENYQNEEGQNGANRGNNEKVQYSPSELLQQQFQGTDTGDDQDF